MGGEKLELDEHPIVRFVQYKALARLGSPSSLHELQGAAQREDEGLLAEFLKDSLEIGGIGLGRSARSARSQRTPAR
jgi:hypothetical protein